MTIDNVKLRCIPIFQKFGIKCQCRHQSNNILVADGANYVKYACSSIGYCNGFLFDKISDFTL